MSLNDDEYYAVAYVAGWIEAKTTQLEFTDEDVLIEGKPKEFVIDLSRGKLSVPHVSSFEFLKAGLCYLKSCRDKVCCQKQLMSILSIYLFEV